MNSSGPGRDVALNSSNAVTTRLQRTWLSYETWAVLEGNLRLFFYKQCFYPRVGIVWAYAFHRILAEWMMPLSLTTLSPQNAQWSKTVYIFHSVVCGRPLKTTVQS